VEERSLGEAEQKSEPLIPRELIERIKRTRRQILKENGGYVFDVVQMLREHRGEN
jgi:hypothetical protein